MDKGLDIPLGQETVERFRKLLIYFIFAVFYLTILSHLTNLYATKNHNYEFFLLFSKNIYTFLFWFGYLVVGTILPLLILYNKKCQKCPIIILISSFLVILGVFCQLYVIIISGQAFPLDLFPGLSESSTFQDGVISPYTPSVYELMLGLGGIGIAAIIYLAAVLVLDFTPKNLEDQNNKDQRVE